MFSEPGHSRSAIIDRLLPVLIGAAGLWMAHHPMVLSRSARIQGETGDSRFINYLLEHGYRWVRAEPIHRAFWDPPFYHPAKNVAAHSDVLVGAAFPYWISRALGTPPDTAFQLWMIAVSILNYLCGYLLFRRGFRFGGPAAAAGSFLIAFAAPRVNHSVHQQLLPCFYVLLAIFALVRIFSDREIRPAGRFLLWLVAALATVGQFYSGFYQGWFLIWTAGLAALAALLLPSCRAGLLGVLSRDLRPILVGSAVGGLVLIPLVSHYMQAERELHQDYYPMMPRLWSWLNCGPHNWIWGWTARLEPIRKLPSGIEDRLGIGFLTTMACAAGLYLRRDRIPCQLSILVLLGWFLCVSRFPVSGNTLSASAMAIAAVGTAMAFRERDRPGPKALTMFGLVSYFGLVRHPNPYAVALGLFTIGLIVVEVFQLRHEPRRLILPWLMLLALCSFLFHPYMVMIGLAMVGPFWAIAEYFRVFRRGDVRAVSTGALATLLVLLMYPDPPWIPAFAAAGPPLLLLATTAEIPRRLPLSGWAWAWITLAALPAIIYCYHTDSLWDSISRDVPGGHAIRGVGRVILMMLVPLGVGLAAFLTTLESRGRKGLAWSIGVVCLLEQGMTGPTYDKQAQRDRVSAIAARVDPRCEAFYYHTRHDGSWVAYVDYQLDAMWASMACGVPTINGYTSVWPRDWVELRLAAFLPDPDVRDALHAWARSRNLDLHRIEWIDHDAGPMRYSPFFGSRPGDPPVPGEPLERVPELLQTK